MGKFNDIAANLSLARYTRIQRYLEILGNHVKLKNKSDKKNITDTKVLLDERIKKLKTIYRISFFFYFGIYVSFISLFFSDVFIIGEIAKLLSKIVGLMGTTVFIVGIYVCAKIKDLYYQDISLLTAHLIALYNKAGYREEKGFFNDENIYNSFLEYFKKRGFE